jgi:hypothetical protein
MSRRTRLAAIAVGVFVFLSVSLLLTRGLVAPGAERTQVLELLRLQAAGDADAVLKRLPDCAAEPACVRVTTERTRKLARPGTVEILNYVPSVQLAITNQEGTARVAWRTEKKRFPVVQCVRVRREGPLSGGQVQLISISNPIGLDAACA